MRATKRIFYGHAEIQNFPSGVKKNITPVSAAKQ